MINSFKGKYFSSFERSVVTSSLIGMIVFSSLFLPAHFFSHQREALEAAKKEAYRFSNSVSIALESAATAFTTRRLLSNFSANRSVMGIHLINPQTKKLEVSGDLEYYQGNLSKFPKLESAYLKTLAGQRTTGGIYEYHSEADNSLWTISNIVIERFSSHELPAGSYDLLIQTRISLDQVALYKDFISNLVILFLAILALLLTQYYLFKNKFLRPLTKLYQDLSNFSSQSDLQVRSRFDGKEIKNITNSFERLIVRIKQEQKIREEKEGLLEIERAKSLQSAKLASLGELSAGIAHEINNPLTIIMGTLPSLGRVAHQDPERFKSKIESLTKAATRIDRIVNGLRKFSRAKSAHKKDLTAHFIADLVQESILLVESKAREHGVQIFLEVDNSLQVHCDPIEIEQVFINLLNNAIDAVRPLNEKWVKVQAFKSGDQTITRVLDSGMGIEKPVQEKLFQPFFTTKPLGQGTGLGLSISKGIVESYGGSIDYKTTPNTCFEVRF